VQAVVDTSGLPAIVQVHGIDFSCVCAGCGGLQWSACHRTSACHYFLLCVCVQAVVDSSGLPAMMTCMEKCDRLSMKKDIMWALSNIAAGTNSQVQAMIDAGVCVYMCVCV
jgi:hypothetical protein